MDRKARNKERLKRWRDRRKQVTVVSNSHQNFSSSDENDEVNTQASMVVDDAGPSDNSMISDIQDGDVNIDTDDGSGLGLGVEVNVGLGLGAVLGVSSPSDLTSDSEFATSSSESDSECLDDENDDDVLCEKLKNWAINNNCTRACINEILGIVAELGGDVPKDSRTLLNTQRDVLQTPMGVGHYIYIGVENRIRKLLSYHDEPRSIVLFINIDGLPIFKSSSINLWPILIRFHPFKPIAVAFYCGKSKPPFNEFVRDFVIETNRLITNGFVFNGVHRSVSLFCFTCDAPARSGLRGTIQHTGYYACERCSLKGKSVRNRIVYDRWDPESDPPIEERTDEVFRQNGYALPDDDGKRHQLDESELVGLAIDIIRDFTLDPMHLVYLGVTRRLLYYLKGSYKKIKAGKLSTAYLNAISRNLDDLKLPSDFARQPRSISDLDRWKATEFKSLLLYTGLVVLRPYLSSDAWKHFLSFSLAIRLLSEEVDAIRNANLDVAKELLKYFFLMLICIMVKRFASSTCIIYCTFQAMCIISSYH
ncbi:uncharacterized protein [Clytia hemisphaerica]|uniref:uncharacterized protein n=1 Tax=Clytia hemisphaerica TaxID=252671 RepID=UPI0034D65F15